MLAQPAVKTIGVNGQISIGKQYAGLQVLVEEREAGVWLVRTADVIPHNERWLHQPGHKAKLDAAMEWATANTASDAGSDAILDRLAGTVDHAE
ncbi:MAG: hypothetical protein LBV80_07510 [Deltaproteobacteria bacterium]|jgi:hypothetical protein|nr:hypothetical protein [Deltaproteobacteria bacterium]